jgi:hypothetical protein
MVMQEPESEPEAAPEQPAGTWLVATDPEAIREVMQNAGYRAELTTDEDGAPLIVSETSRSQFWVTFLDCGSDSGCLAVELYVGYTVSAPPAPETLNDFNTGYRYVRTYTTGDVVAMAMDILMQNGGIDQATFLEYLRLWTVILPDWETAMGV